MGTSLDELLNAEFKEAFDEFDKVYLNMNMANKSRAFCRIFALCIIQHKTRKDTGAPPFYI